MTQKEEILSNEEIVKLIKKYKKNNCIKSRNKVIMSNIRSVYLIAHKYKASAKNNSFTFDDLVSDGVIGVMEAIEKFDEKRNINFSTYVYWWIFKHIHKNISFGTLDLPIHRLSLFQKYEKLMQDCSNKNIELSIDEICKHLKVTKKTILDTISKKDIFCIDNLPTSINSSDKTKRAIESKEEFESHIFKKITVDKIKKIIVDNLSDREAEIINGRFGLEDGEPKTLELMEEEMGISHEYIRILQNRGIEKIQNILKVFSGE